MLNADNNVAMTITGLILQVFVLVLYNLPCVFAATHDFGASDAHTPVVHAFVLHNTTDKPLAIATAKASCACLTVDCLRTPVAPNCSLPVTCTMSLAGMEGEIEKKVVLTLAEGSCPGPIVSNASPQPSSAIKIKDTTQPVELVLKGTVKVRIGLKPQDVAFGILPETARLEPVIVKLHGYATEATITEISGAKNPVIPVAIGKDKCSLIVSPPQKLSNGMFSEIWTIKTTDPEVPELKLPVSMTISSNLEVLPERVALSTNIAVFSRSVLLRPSQGKPSFRVLAAETAPRQWGEVEIRERPLGGWQILITNIDTDFVRQMSKQPFLKITTDCTGNELLEVPVRMEIQQ